jgi:hypothetical protein
MPSTDLQRSNIFGCLLYTPSCAVRRREISYAVRIQNNGSINQTVQSVATYAAPAIHRPRRVLTPCGYPD